MRRTGIAIALVLTSACGHGLQRTGGHDYGASAPPTNRNVGTSVQLPTPTPAAAATAAATEAPAGATGPAFFLRLTDTHGRHPAEIPVRVSGPVNAVMKTNASGEIVLSKGGVYQLSVVAGCSESVQVFSGGHATAGVNPAQPSHGELRVDWRHRMTPAPPVFSNPQAPWPRGKDVTVSFKTIDRCTQQFAPNASYPTFRFGTSPNLRVSKPPVLRSDAKSVGYVTVRCSAPGDVKLVVFDSADPTDTFNIARESSDYAPPSCA